MHSGRQNGRPAPSVRFRRKNIADTPRMTGAPNAVRLNTLFPEQTVAVSIPEA